MKKYPIFFFLSLIMLVVSIYTPEAMYASLPQVNYIKVKKQNANKTITVTGKIESKEENIQTADCVYFISDVLVSSGEKVEKGDNMERKSGVLMHISSLFGDYSIGGFSDETKCFVDFLSDCGF